jgi:CheY-like chemotaxis protein
MVLATQPVEGSATLQRILVVDDDVHVAQTIQAGLESLPNCEVEIAAGSEQALQAFEQKPFDLLITDYRMPGIDGILLATRARQLYPRTVTIMITAYDNDTLRKRAVGASIRCILDKPVGLGEIRNIALEALEQPIGAHEIPHAGPGQEEEEGTCNPNGC